MRGLLLKDFLTNKLVFLGVIGVNLLFSMPILLMFNGESSLLDGAGVQVVFKMFAVFPFIINSMLISALLQQDEKKLYSSFIISAPGGVFRQVSVKYLLAVLISAISVGFSGIVNLLFAHSSGDLKDISTFRFTVILACALLIVTSIELPFYFRFGTKRGSAIRIIITSCVAIAALRYLLFGDLTVIFGEGDADDRVDRIMNALVNFGANYEKKLLVPMLIAAAAALLVSWFCSTLFYKKGAESFSQ